MKADRPCKKCGKPIRFLKTEAGRTMPVSLDSVEKRLVLDGRGGCKMVDTYLSHFADCEAADFFREKRTKP